MKVFVLVVLSVVAVRDVRCFGFLLNHDNGDDAKGYSTQKLDQDGMTDTFGDYLTNVVYSIEHTVDHAVDHTGHSTLFDHFHDLIYRAKDFVLNVHLAKKALVTTLARHHLEKLSEAVDLLRTLLKADLDALDEALQPDLYELEDDFRKHADDLTKCLDDETLKDTLHDKIIRMRDRVHLKFHIILSPFDHLVSHLKEKLEIILSHFQNHLDDITQKSDDDFSKGH